MTLVLAHRGDHRHHPENTIAAFEAARACGADGVELDARRTADGLLVVHHDDAIAGASPIDATPAADLPSGVPTLASVLDACAGLLVNVEIKRAPHEPDGSGSTGALVARLLDERRGEDQVVVSSFAPDALASVAAHAPWVERAWLVPASAASLDLVGIAVAAGYLGLHPHYEQVDSAFVERAHGAGLALRVWTVNDASRGRALADLGVDALITDDVPAVRAALG